MSSLIWSSTVSMKLREETVSRSRDGALRVVDVGGACVRTTCLPKEATMAVGSVREGSAGRVLTRSLLVRGGWEGERRVSTYLCAPCFLFLTSSSSFPVARSFLSSHSSCSFRPSHVLCRMRRACRSERVRGKHVAGEKKNE